MQSVPSQNQWGDVDTDGRLRQDAEMTLQAMSKGE
jgi:hypothetical protein